MMRSTPFRLCDTLISFYALLFVIHGGRGAQVISNGPRKTIHSEDGDIIDCFEINEQPAFDNPLLKDHKIQLRPSSFPEELVSKDAKMHPPLMFELEEGGCPKGTVPIQRLSKSVNSSLLQFEETTTMKRVYAVRKSYQGNYLGVTASLNVYPIEPIGEKQMSLSAVWVVNKNAPSSKQTMLLAGWMVNPLLFGDRKPRLFMQWTVDGGNHTYTNFQHPGFVQIDSTCQLGYQVWPLSRFNGTQHIIFPYIYKDEVTGNWWLAINGKYMGYWPKELFYNFDHATEVYYGGMVTCPSNEQCPPMGNGLSPASMKACFITGIEFLDNKYSWQDLQPGSQYAYTNVPDCYTVGPYENENGGGYNFRFGGSVCPI